MLRSHPLQTDAGGCSSPETSPKMIPEHLPKAGPASVTPEETQSILTTSPFWPFTVFAAFSTRWRHMSST